MGATCISNVAVSATPTIILDAGQGGWSSDWVDIMPELSENNRVCVAAMIRTLPPQQLLNWAIALVGLSVFTAAELQGMSLLMRGEQAN